MVNVGVNPVKVTVKLLANNSLSDSKLKVATSPSLTAKVGIGAKLLLSERAWFDKVGFLASKTISLLSARFDVLEVT